MNPVLQRLLDQRAEQETFIDQLLARVAEEDRDLVDAERSNLQAARDRVTALDEQITPLEEWETLRATHRESAALITPPQAQQPGRGQSLARTAPRGHEYRTRGELIVDVLVAADVSNGAESPAGRMFFTEEQKRAAVERMQGARVNYTGAPEDYRRALENETTGDIPGLLPKPIVGPVENDLDAARPFIQSIGAKDLGNIPGKTFTRPTITTHTASGQQTAEKTELVSGKLEVDGIDFTKETYGGAVDVSRQSIDWSSPAAWDALLTDLQDAYGINTEEVAAGAFATAITQSVAAPGTNDLAGWATALYQAAALAYGGAKRLPTGIWVSLDMWAQMGAVVDSAKLRMRGDTGDGNLGDSSPRDFSGNVLDLPRTVVPSFPAGTVIVGYGAKTEFYEQRIGLLSAVEPRLLGVEIAYGGYVAYGTLNPLAFARIGAEGEPSQG